MQLVKYEKAIELSVPDAKHQAVAWLGQAGLYRTRFDAVRNFEQSIIPINTDELFNLASKQALSELRVGGQSACPCSADTNANDPEGHA